MQKPLESFNFPHRVSNRSGSLVRKLFLLLFIGVMAWFWWSSMWTRQIARDAAKDSCRKFGLQLIDDTVERVALRFVRDQNGTLRLARLYKFEFTTTGERRFNGYVSTLGKYVEGVKLDPYTT